MSRKDSIFETFMKHPMLKEKYKLKDEQIKISLKQASNSDVAIIKSIALLVSEMEGHSTSSQSTLKNMVLQYLNTAAI